MKHFKEDREKLAELILYVCQKCADDPCFGATKLNKILYFADFLHYGNYGQPITGAEYQKLPYGPAPKRLLPIRQKLEEKARLVFSRRRWSAALSSRSPLISGRRTCRVLAVMRSRRLTGLSRA